MTTNLDVGDAYSITPAGTDNGTKGIPPWMEWSGGSATGDAELPSGYRKITLAEIDLTDSDPVSISDASVDIAPVALPADTQSPWRVAIFEAGGAYAIADGLTGIPTIGTPQVRLTRSAPSKAVVKFPAGRGAVNILGADFGRWSDSIARPITRGMELTVEYRDKDSGTLMLVFRGRIFQIESGETVTVTAYDRLMDLYQTTGQYLSHAGSTQGVRTENRVTSGTDYIYETGETLGIITGLDSIDRLCINASGATGDAQSAKNITIIHGLPSNGGITPEAGDIISRIQVKYGGSGHGGYQAGTPVLGPKYASLAVYCEVYVMESTASGFMVMASGTAPTVTRTASTQSTAGVPFSLDASNQTADITLNTPYTIQDPSRVFIGVRVTMAIAVKQAGFTGTSWGANKSSTRYTTATADYYSSTDNGTTWAPYTAADKPELGVTFTHPTNPIDPSLATVSGTKIIIAQASIPAGPTDTYLSTEETGVGIIADYYEADKAPLAEIAGEIIEAAGLAPEIGPTVNLGLVTLYTVVTTDYLTALQEIIEARGYGLKDSITNAGHISLLPEHTVDEAPADAYTTVPSGSGKREILAHNLTAHWAAEKATVAYIAENATASGLPLALETDDGLMDGSLIETLQTPLSAVTVDNTLGTHDMMAHVAGGAIRRLHTNTIEGSITLGGYHPALWDLSGAGVGGYPLEIDVPEYQARGTVVPTEIILADGVTVVQLNNIRTQDRSGVARSMGLVEGSVSNDASLLPKTVYIFGKGDGENQIPDGETLASLDGITLARADGTTIVQNNSTYLKTATDSAGYLHLLAVFPEAAGTYTSASPISAVVAEITTDGGTQHITALVDPPKYILDNQNIHVDLRIRNP